MGSDRQAVGSGASGCRHTGQSGGTVTVVMQGHTARQGTRFTNGHARILWETGGVDGERVRNGLGKRYIVHARDGRCLVNRQGKALRGI